MSTSKKQPLRKCVVTKEMFPKKSLIRVVRNKEGEVFVDETGKKNGRGAYVSKDEGVIETARTKNILSTHLNAKVDSSLYDELLSIVKGNKSE
ncbi:hypothetical protein N781_12010 [Pontibacillus halophilus JSM 076056 = DSM 19796]|uniref:YlxR domain-containing protein n=1 Tax=Pontibacillus halophilus JSM 076056 = DSM 19796 TaxID=1385510 RepID=A0A0A5GMD4_9BACI|nr:YlxR family protein [Pontibacillus halophilus]KGX93134.1 hypothetical protein N781_12010 [Pontibacillus halophilus JSM 076056 = DSM 19796]